MPRAVTQATETQQRATATLGLVLLVTVVATAYVSFVRRRVTEVA